MFRCIGSMFFQAFAWGMRMVSHFFIGTYAIDSCCVYMCQIKNGIYQLFYTSWFIPVDANNQHNFIAILFGSTGMKGLLYWRTGDGSRTPWIGRIGSQRCLKILFVRSVGDIEIQMRAATISIDNKLVCYRWFGDIWGYWPVCKSASPTGDISHRDVKHNKGVHHGRGNRCACWQGNSMQEL